MVFAVIIAKKKYSVQRYFFVFFIVIAVVMFILESKKGNTRTDKADQNIGIYLVVTSLVLDGLTGATQEHLRTKIRPSTSEFMFNINKWSFLILVSIMACTGEGRDFINFAIDHPDMIVHVSTAILVGTLGQWFVNAILAEFGSLSVSLVTTTRKFMNMLLSVILSFNNHLSIIQWASTVVVFGCLILDSLFGKNSKPKQKENDAISDGATSTTSVSPAQSESEKDKEFV